MSVNFIYMTAGSKEEARKIGKELVVARLAACVNILDNMNSFYMWQGNDGRHHRSGTCRLP